MSQKRTRAWKVWVAARSSEWPGRELLLALQAVRRRDSHRPVRSHLWAIKFNEILGPLEAVILMIPVTDSSSRSPPRLSAQTLLGKHLLFE